MPVRIHTGWCKSPPVMSLQSPLTTDIPTKPREIGVMFANLRFPPGICMHLHMFYCVRSSDADEPCWASHCGRQVPLLLQTLHPIFRCFPVSVFTVMVSTTVHHPSPLSTTMNHHRPLLTTTNHGFLPWIFFTNVRIS